MARFLVILVMVIILRFCIIGCGHMPVYDGKTFYNAQLRCNSELKGRPDEWCKKQEQRP
jgi:hypothetical protein